VKVAKLILFLVLIAIFFYFFYIMVVSFYTAINVIRPPSDACSNASMVQGLCKAYYNARRRAIAIFNLVAIGLFLAFIISLIVLYVESRHEHYRSAYRG